MRSIRSSAMTLESVRSWADTVAQKVAYYEGVLDGADGECQLPA